MSGDHKVGEGKKPVISTPIRPNQTIFSAKRRSCTHRAPYPLGQTTEVRI